jgi:hypothetical protein
LRQARRVSKAPWSSLEDRLSDGELSWLLANARNAPQNGSYTFALAALRPCERLQSQGPIESQREKLKSIPEPGLRAAKMGALEFFEKRCAELAGVQLRDELITLRNELPASGDAVYKMQQKALTELGNERLELQRRDELLRSLLALDDPAAVAVLTGAIARPGAKFEGKEIGSGMDAAAYQAAWALVACADYGDCGGPDSVEAHEACLYANNCDYMDRWRRVESALPAPMYDRVRDYYDRIRGNLARGNYGAFGLK